MKRLVLAFSAVLTMLSPSAPAGAQGGEIPPVMAPCNVRLNVTDQDPAGLNVRDRPDGRIILTLKARNQWVQVHVTDYLAGWTRIDRATLYDDGLRNGERSLFSGGGFVAISKLGVETLNPGAALSEAPNEGARVLWRAPRDDSAVPAAKVLACYGSWLQLRVGGVTGWTRGFCSNQRTTCV